MADLSLLPEDAADSGLASGSPEYQCGDRTFGPSDLFLSPGQGISGLLPTVWTVRVRAV